MSHLRSKLQLSLVFLAINLQLSLPALTGAEGLPSTEDTPEEILRTEIYTEARSPVDGKLLTAAEYIELQEDLAIAVQNFPPESQVSAKVRELIGLLKLRKTLRQIIPFIP